VSRGGGSPVRARLTGWAVAVGLVAALAAGCTESSAPDDSLPDRGREYPVDTKRVTVGVGERFSVVVTSNASIGDNWVMRVQPDQAVLTTTGADYVPDASGDVVGGGGREFFVFTGKAAGTTTFELYNCFRGCQSEEDLKRSVAHTVDVTVG